MATTGVWSRVAPTMRSRPWITVAVIGLVIRVALAIPAIGEPQRFYVAPDSYEYEQLAINLVRWHGYSLASGEPYQPDVRRTPVYPLLLAGVYTAVGHHPSAAVAVNVILGTLGCVLTALLGRRLFGADVGLLAGLFLATDLTSAVYSLTLMTEPLFTVLLLVVTLSAVRFLARGGAWPIVLAGLCCGIAILTRPIALLLPIFLGPTLAWLGPGASRRARLWFAGSFTIVALAFPLAWTVRNYQVAGVAQPTSLIAINSYYHRAAPLEAARRGVSVAAVRDEFAGALEADRDSTPSEQSAHVTQMELRAIQVIAADPVGYIAFHLAGVTHLLGPDQQMLARLMASSLVAVGSTASSADSALPGSPVRLYNNSQTLLLGALQLLALYALALWGLAVGVRRTGARRGTLLIVVLLAYFLLISGPEAYARFRVPAMPFVSLLAAGGALALWAQLRALRPRLDLYAPGHRKSR